MTNMARAQAPSPLMWFERWRDRFSAACNRLLASPRFRHWAADFPLTRPIARRRARQVFDLCAGFVYSQILSACVRLSLFDILAEGPQTASALSRRFDLSLEATERLLAAAVSLRLVARASGARYRLGPLGAPLVGNAAITAMVEHHAVLYADLADPLALLRADRRQATALGNYWAYRQASEATPQDAAASAAYSSLMSASQPLVAEDLLDAYPFADHRCLLDVGGGEGTFLASVAARIPSLQLQLFDLPPVAERGRVRLEARGFGDRTQTFGGSFLTDALPLGADLVSLVRVIHDHDDEAVRTILRAVRTVLPPGGVVLIAEPMSGTPGAEPIGDAYFGFYLLAMGRGRPRTAEQLSKLLIEAGFSNPLRLRTRMPLQTSLIKATVARASSPHVSKKNVSIS